jgi:hypothetical protein
MMIHSKFNGYKAGRRTYFDGGGGVGGDGGPAMGDVGSVGSVDGALGMHGISSDNGYGANDYQSPYSPGLAGLPSVAQALSEYRPQDQPSANTDIYRPTYTDYATGPANAVSSYGQNMQSPFGAFADPFSKGGSQGIAGLYNQPEYADYGLAGLNR